MEFGWSDHEEAFRSRVEEALARCLPPDWSRSATSVGGSQASPESNAVARALAADGLLVCSWPPEFGGEGASRWEQLILAEVMWRHGEPRGPQYMNVNWIGPAIMQFGTEEQKRELLLPMARGGVIWCQGFSEPDAGSDLAALRTRADRDGDDYVINGQKIWTSYAGDAQYCFLLARTDPEAARRRGISVLVVPMDTPGVEVRRIPSLVGGHAFHQVDFVDARVPTSVRLGEENEGWTIVRSALANERVGLPRYIRASLVLDGVAGWARERGLLTETWVQARLGEARAACEAARLLVYRAADDQAKGRGASAFAYVARVAVVDAERAVADASVDVMGAHGLVLGSLADGQMRNSMGGGIASGTYEVQLNLIASELLGLPRG
ncbi:MAG: acyl-CoA dehydrogenase family protein [Acidimicrobiia bacterium]|jgi:alkylation response protein AidB-like acyl-CoA dehydrogenase